MTRPRPLLARALVLGCLAVTTRVAGAQEPGPVRLDGGDAPAAVDRPADRILRVARLGPTDAQRASGTADLRFPFASRADEEIASAQIRVALRAGLDAPVDVLVNGEQVASIATTAAASAQAITVNPVLLGVRNELSLRVRTVPGPGCRVPARPWAALEAVEIRTEARPVPLPDDLALLPLPFADPGFDAGAAVPIVVTVTDAERVRLAALVASWFAVDAPIPITFTTEIGALPATRAIALVDGPDDAAVLGVPAPRGPSIRMIDHPRFPGANVKVVVIGGRTAAELRMAVETLARGTPRLAGREVMLPVATAAAPAPAAPYAAPRWFAPGKPVQLTAAPANGSFGHDGATPGVLSSRFRVAPDLWIWPTPAVRLDLAWEQRTPPGMPPPRLDVELNGYFLTTLPALPGEGRRTGRARVAIPREHMRGFNELRVYVQYPAHDPCAGAAAASTGRGRPDVPHVALTGESLLHLEPFSLFAMQPDVARFAYDGFPFTRIPDLGETAFVLPAAPSAAEIATVLTLMGRFAQITGRIGWRARVLAATADDAALSRRDLVVIGGPDDNALVARWERLLPVWLDAQGGRLRPRDALRATDELLGGITPLLETRRAARLLASDPRAAAVIGIESPASPGRTALVVTAPAGRDLPPFERFLGYAEGRAGSADVLLLADGRRAALRLGTAFGRGELDGWTQLRWFLSTHWVTLLPLVAVGAWLTAHELRGTLDRAMRERLRAPEDP